MSTLIYHGTPLTPRAALDAIMPGRAGCVSFYRPDDMEVLLAICPWLMFRPWRVFVLDGGATRWSGMGREQQARLVAGLLSLAGARNLPSRPLGAHPGQPRRAIANQRRSAERFPVRRSWRAGVAYGWTYRAAGAALREIPSRSYRVDRASETGASRLHCLPAENGRGCRSHGERLAPPAHASRRSSCLRLSVHRRGRDNARTERMAIRQPYGRHLGRTMAWALRLREPA